MGSDIRKHSVLPDERLSCAISTAEQVCCFWLQKYVDFVENLYVETGFFFNYGEGEEENSFFTNLL